MNFFLFSPAQIDILRQLQAIPVIGVEALRRLDEAFARSTNPIAVTEALNNLIGETKVLADKIERTFDDFSLNDFVEEKDETTGYIEIVFDDGAGFKNFWEAQDRAKEWKLIIQAIAELTGEDFEKIQTVSWNSGCPEIGVWVKGGITFINAIKAFGKIVSQLKYLKDSIIGNKEKAKDLGGDGESLKVFQEGIERNILGIYQEKKSTSTIELKRTFGKNSKRPDGDGNNFLEMAFEKAVQQLVDGVRIVDPEEITPIPVTVNRSDGILPEPTIGELYRKQFEQEESLQQYIEAETQKRLAERTKLMKQELGIIEEKDESVAEELNEQSQNKDENTNTSQQDELFEEPVIVSEDLAAKPSKK